MTKSFKQAENYFFGIALVVLAVLAVWAGFSNSLSLHVVGGVAFVLSAIALVKTYFGWLAPRLAAVFVVTAVLLFAGACWLRIPKPESNKYQAVFLSNGQVYFGHLENAQSANPVLKDVYYLQSNSQNPQNTQSTNSSQLTLVKLGNELHAPESQMVIKSDQILFWENLKDSGKVVQTIKQQSQTK